MRFFILLISLGFLFSSCEFFRDEQIEMQEVYSITDGACGSLVLDERLGSDFRQAFKKFKTQKQAY